MLPAVLPEGKTAVPPAHRAVVVHVVLHRQPDAHLRVIAVGACGARRIAI